MILSIAGVKPGSNSKGVTGELHVNTPLLAIFPYARNHLAEWAQTTKLTDNASAYILRIINTK